MKKTLYVSDLDGTLLDSNSQLSEETIAVLNELITERGVNFSIATARTPATVMNIMERVPMRLPMVVMNGAAMWNNAERKFESMSAIDLMTVDEVCGIFELHGLHPMVYRRNGNRLFVNHYGTLSSQEKAFVAERTGLALKHFQLNDFFYKRRAGNPLLIFSMNEYDRLKPVYEEISEEVDCSVEFYRDIFDSDAGMIEVYAPGVSKAVAVRRLADKVGAERLVVFGDNRNDIPMMRIADLAIAPENAMPEVKAVAHKIIGANTTHSVAHYIASSISSLR